MFTIEFSFQGLSMPILPAKGDGFPTKAAAISHAERHANAVRTVQREVWASIAVKDAAGAIVWNVAC